MTITSENPASAGAPHSLAPPRIGRVYLLGIWTGVGLIAVAQSYAGAVASGWSAPPFSRQVIWQLAPWLLWAFATNVILSLGRRYPLDRAHWRRSIAVHFAVASVLGILQNLFYLGTSYTTEVVPLWLTPGRFYIGLLSSRLLSTYMIYGGILGVGYAVDYAGQLSARELEREQLERQLIGARLDALRMQLQPHFLFNALNTTAVLVRESGSRDALRVVLDLSDMLRAVLDEHAPQQIPLRDEIALLGKYLDIESVRFADRLRVALDVSDDAGAAAVPRLILQPLVENAIRHGIAASADGGRVSITASASHGTLRMSVQNDGPPLGSGNGLGLCNVRERLDRLYPGTHAFTIANVPGGVDVRIEIPLQPVPVTNGNDPNTDR